MTDTTNSALLACPFCGSPVSLERATDTYEYDHGRRQWWGVVCRNTENLGGTCAIYQRPSASPEAAIERWNRRASLQPAAVGELTDEQILQIADSPECNPDSGGWGPKFNHLTFARAILAHVSGVDSSRQDQQKGGA